jgi:thioredoxin 2
MIVKCASCASSNRVPAERLAQSARCGHCRAPLSPTAEPYPIASATEFDELLSKSPVPVLVDFWAPWCGPCRTVAPELEKLAKQRRGSVLVAKLNTEELPRIANRFSIQSIPTFILFKQGREIGRATGAMPAYQIENTVGL